MPIITVLFIRILAPSRKSKTFMKILTVIGARPQFIKAASISRSIYQYNESFGLPPINEIILH